MNPTTNVELSPVEAQLLLQSLDNSVRAGKLDETIRGNGAMGLSSIAKLCNCLAEAAEHKEQPDPPDV